jgi:putative ABC transport system permease protein
VVVEEFPTIRLEDRTELKESSAEQLDSFLAVIFVFLGLALVIAVMGIAITLSLSVFERTRELGLLRAVGMTKIQMRRMVRWEAVIVALFGALLGVALGLLFGVAAARAIPETVIKTLSIPVGQLVMFFVIAALAGIAAAVFPAYRASRMKVLDAIAEE